MTSYQMIEVFLMTPPPSPLKPARFAEHQLVTGILDGRFPPGSALPGERDLAGILGVTRPTLRETLRALDREGWVRIRHGKPTLVNDLQTEGGLGCLGTLARHRESLPPSWIESLLHVREMLLPPAAARAAAGHRDALAGVLAAAGDLPDRPEAFARFDWALQVAIVRRSDNPILNLLYNDFASVFIPLADRYFAVPETRAASRDYYAALGRALDRTPDAVGQTVHRAMAQSIRLWRRIAPERGRVAP